MTLKVEASKILTQKRLEVQLSSSVPALNSISSTKNKNSSLKVGLIKFQFPGLRDGFNHDCIATVKNEDSQAKSINLKIK